MTLPLAMKSRIGFPGVVWLLLLVSLAAWGATPVERPKLVVLISIDQMRADYLTRHDDLFLPAMGKGRASRGGFKFIRESGAWFADAHHTHYPLFTGPGHAVLLTGAHPYKSGIVGNYWFDRETWTNRYCVADPAGKIVGNSGSTKLPAVSPVSLKVTTVGDELKMATAGQAKVWALGLKDRAAILMGGHLADGALWFDENSGNWVTSRYYATNGAPREWLKRFNDERLVDKLTNNVWNFERTAALGRTWTPPEKTSRPVAGTNYQALAFTPYGNDLVFALARRIITEERLGRAGLDESKSPLVADVLAINLSSNDYVGHERGPDSAEMLDITLRTDAQISAFINWLAEQGLWSRTLFIVTSDHGVSPLPLQMKDEAHFEGGRGFEAQTAEAVNRFLAGRYGIRDTNSLPAKVVEFNLYLDVTRLVATNDTPGRVHAEVARFLEDGKDNGIYAAYPRERILRGELPRTDIAERVMKGFHPRSSGDVVLIPEPYWIQLNESSKRYQSSHGSPYAYDTAVPLLIAGPGIKHCQVTEKVSTLDIAPTISFLLGVLQPSGSEGSILKCLRE